MKFAINTILNKGNTINIGVPFKLDKVSIYSHISYDLVELFTSSFTDNKELTEADKTEMEKLFLKIGGKFAEKIEIKSNLFNFTDDSYLDLSSKANNKILNANLAINSELDITDKARDLIKRLRYFSRKVNNKL